MNVATLSFKDITPTEEKYQQIIQLDDACADMLLLIYEIYTLIITGIHVFT